MGDIGLRMKLVMASRLPITLSTFDPGQLNLAGGLWLKADAADITLAGSKVSAIAPRGVTTFEATQTTDANRPEWQASNANFNNTPTLEFDPAASENMIAHAASAVFNQADPSFSLFMCLRFTGTIPIAATRMPWGTGRSSGTGDGDIEMYPIAGPNWRMSANKSPTTVNVESTSAATNDAVVVGFVRNGNTGSIYVGKTPEDPTDMTTIPANTYDLFCLGALPRAAAIQFTADMEFAEIVALPRALSVVEIDNLVDYLAVHRGIPV